MQKIGDVIHHRDRDDFSEGDHGEHVESGLRDIVLIGAISLLLIGAFISSLFS